ncbi:uncharacterized protein [Nicotiana sylvestris]|uniref:uncharacterized protein n=1 Tax=Nicotiana sylvestris TaxID=4096 RepID=UPI00388C7F2D
MPAGKLAKWQILLSEFNIVYVTQKAVKGQALADHLAENPVVGDIEPLKTYFPDEEVSFVGEDITEAYEGWRMFFDGAANFKGVGVGAVLVSKAGVTGDWIFGSSGTSSSRRVGYEKHQDITIFLSCAGIDEKIHKDRIQNEFADALATLTSMIQHPDKNFIDPVLVRIQNQPAYYAHVEEDTNGKPWFHDIKEYLTRGKYPKQTNHTQKHTLRRLSNNFFQSKETLYRRTPDLGLLRCVEAKEASILLEEIPAGTYGPHMNGFVLAKKKLRDGYFWMTMEMNYIRYVQKCHQCQVHSDVIRVPPNELSATSAPWPFAVWGINVIGLIKPTASNGHRFILVSIDYFTKCVEAASNKVVTKKVDADFVKDLIVC